jgi:hypothetical protein
MDPQVLDLRQSRTTLVVFPRPRDEAKSRAEAGVESPTNPKGGARKESTTTNHLVPNSFFCWERLAMEDSTRNCRGEQRKGVVRLTSKLP